MLDFLAGVPGKLKTLVDRLTSTRAANLDNLDAAVTTRAAASTALSTAQWTNTRAGYLDNLATAPPTTMIQSIQYGSITLGTSETSDTATISSVTTAKTVLVHLGQTTNSTTQAGTQCRLTLTNATTVTADRNSTDGASSTTIVRFCAVEFK